MRTTLHLHLIVSSEPTGPRPQPVNICSRNFGRVHFRPNVNEEGTMAENQPPRDPSPQPNASFDQLRGEEGESIAHWLS